MKTNRRLSPPDDDERIVKKIFLLTCAGTLAVCAISVSPHWTLRLLLGVGALLAMVYELGRIAPVGYEDETGFHYAGAPRARRRRRRTDFSGSLLGSSRSPLKA